MKKALYLIPFLIILIISGCKTEKAQKIIQSNPSLNTWTDCKSMNQMQLTNPENMGVSYMQVFGNVFKMRVLEINNDAEEATLEIQVCDGKPSPYENAKVDVVAVNGFKTILSTSTFFKNSIADTVKVKLNDKMSNPVQVTALIYADVNLSYYPTASQYVEFSWK